MALDAHKLANTFVLLAIPHPFSPNEAITPRGRSKISIIYRWSPKK